jgi:microcystin-dependent protein
MAEPFLGELRLFPFSVVPRGWLPCQGQVLQIMQNQAMYSLLGTQYGGNGTTTFQLPDLRGRVPVQMNPQGGLNVGNQAGAENVALALNTMPGHTHALMANAAAGTSASPKADFFAGAVDATHQIYAPATVGSTVVLNAAMLDPVGSGAGHDNMQPFQTVQFCIATQGLYPQRQ